MPVTSAPLLFAATPAEWLATHLVRHQARRDDPDETAASLAGRTWVGTADVLAGGGALLRTQHEQIRAEDEATPAAAAKWVVSRFAGKLGKAFGFTLAAASAALVPDPSQVRWRLHPQGWPDRVEFGSVGPGGGLEIAVAADHVWAGLRGVRLLPDERAVAAAATDALVRLTSPILDGVRPLARVGRNAMWAEVADAFGLAVCFDLELPVAQSALDRLGAALGAPGHPWRQLPEVRVTRADGHAIYLGRKGGCCLYYQCPPRPEPDPTDLAERERAYQERFPRRPGDPHYCATCSLLDQPTSEARQLYWLELERAARAVPN